MNDLIRLTGVTKTYATAEGLFQPSGTVFNAVDSVSLSISSGENLGIVGESGSGKTTLARMMCGIIRPDAGAVLYRGEDITAMSKEQYRVYRKNVQMVFQDPFSSLNPKLSIRSALSDGVRRHITDDKREVNRRLGELMELVGLSESHLDRYPHEFSGGQRQRISFARALSLEPELIIADEPVSSLDVSVQAQILNLMRTLQKEKQLTIALISHDLAVVSYLCQNVLVMKSGICREYGATQQVLSAPADDYTKLLLASSGGQV